MPIHRSDRYIVLTGQTKLIYRSKGWAEIIHSLRSVMYGRWRQYLSERQREKHAFTYPIWAVNKTHNDTIYAPRLHLHRINIYSCNPLSIRVTKRFNTHIQIVALVFLVIKKIIYCLLPLHKTYICIL